VPAREFNKLCIADYVSQLPGSLTFAKVAPYTLMDFETSLRDPTAYVTYFMCTFQSLESIVDHITDEDQDLETYTLAFSSIFVYKASIIDQAHEDTAFFLMGITLIRTQPLFD
jgi:hypothetical protein